MRYSFWHKVFGALSIIWFMFVLRYESRSPYAYFVLLALILSLMFFKIMTVVSEYRSTVKSDKSSEEEEEEYW